MRTLINLSITTVCNMRCPDCSYGMRWRLQRHATLEEIRHVCGFLSDMIEVQITGGEPTVHPHFSQICDLVIGMLPQAMVCVETNGVNYPLHRETFKKMGRVNVSHYTAASWPGCPDNTAQVEALKADFPLAGVGEITHLPFANATGTKPCERQTKAMYSMGKIYGCCTASGMQGACGIEPSPDWQRLLDETPLPCKGCPFAL